MRYIIVVLNAAAIGYIFIACTLDKALLLLQNIGIISAIGQTLLLLVFICLITSFMIIILPKILDNIFAKYLDIKTLELNTSLNKEDLLLALLVAHHFKLDFINQKYLVLKSLTSSFYHKGNVVIEYNGDIIRAYGTAACINKVASILHKAKNIPKEYKEGIIHVI